MSDLTPAAFFFLNGVISYLGYLGLCHMRVLGDVPVNVDLKGRCQEKKSGLS